MIVGVLGGGQLARLMALAAERIGARVVCLDPAADACAGTVTPQLRASFDDRAALAEFAARCDVVTYEFENVPVASIGFLAERVPVFPGVNALAAAADRIAEKTLFNRLGMKTAAFAAVGDLDELHRAAAELGLPALLKTRHAGYDGKGQRLIRNHDEIPAAWAQFAGAPAILEAIVPFDRELSMVGVRGRDGAMAFYPMSENRHRGGILRLALSRPGDPWQQPAQDMAATLMDSLDYVGVLALELFQRGDALLASEFAPRVHNSGHWTTRGAATSQFENHLRAVMGLPLGPTAAVGAAAMVNFIGRMPDPVQVLAVPNAHLHAYGKLPRPGRKVGHATVHSGDAASCEQLAGRLLELAAAASDG